MSPSPEFPERFTDESAAPRATPVEARFGALDATAANGPQTAVRAAVRRMRSEYERHAGTLRAREVSEWLARPAGVELPARNPLAFVRERDDSVASATAPAADPLPGLLAQLQAVTTRYVCRMRADGLRPEQMLVRVKTCVRDAMTAEGWQDPRAVQTITAAVVTWSIAAYYDR